MKTKTKKIVAREFLLIIAVAVLAMLTWLVIELMEMQTNRNIDKSHKDISLNAELIDRFNKPGDIHVSDRLFELYNGLSQRGEDVPKTYSSFVKTLSDTGNAKKYYRYLLDVKSNWNREELYNILNEKSLYSKSYEDFQSQFSNGISREKLYDALKEKGIYLKSLEEFNTEFFGDIIYPDDNIWELYNNLEKDNYDLPEYLIFKRDLYSTETRRTLYDNLKEDNWEIPSFEQFSLDLGFHVETNDNELSNVLQVIGFSDFKNYINAESKVLNQINNDERSLKEELQSLREKRNKLSSFDIMNIAYVLLLIIYPLRFIVIALIWSVKTLRS